MLNLLKRLFRKKPSKADVGLQTLVTYFVALCKHLKVEPKDLTIQANNHKSTSDFLFALEKEAVKYEQAQKTLSQTKKRFINFLDKKLKEVKK